MTRLVDTVDLSVPAERVWEWLRALPDTYARWSPDHLWLEVEEGGCGEPARVRWCRRVGGVPYEAEGRVVRCEHGGAGFRVEVSSDGGFASTSLVCVPTSAGSCRLTCAEEFGLREGRVGSVANFVLLDLLGTTRAAERDLLDAMRRDDAYLKCILEDGIWPADGMRGEPSGAPVRSWPMTRAALRAAGGLAFAGCALAAAFMLGSRARRG